MPTKSTIKIQYVLFGELKVPIFKWKGYERAGSLRYNSLKESLLSLARELVEQYFDDIE